MLLELSTHGSWRIWVTYRNNEVRDADTALVGKAEGKDLLEILRLNNILKLLNKQFSLSSPYVLPDSTSLKNVTTQGSNFYWEPDFRNYTKRTLKFIAYDIILKEYENRKH